MSGIATAVIGGAIIGGVVSSNNANKAVDAQTQASQLANQTQSQMYNQTRADQQPWRTAGGNALSALSQWYGLPGTQSSAFPVNSSGAQGAGLGGNADRLAGTRGFNGGPPTAAMMQAYQGGQGQGQQQGQPQQQQGGAPDYNAILSNLPGYQFQLQQGNQAMQRNLAAHGMLDSGAAQKELTQYGQGVASNYADKYVNGLQSMAGLGQTANQATGAAGMNAANQISSGYGYAGNAAASGYANQSNAWNQAISGVTGGLSMYANSGAQSGGFALNPAYQDTAGLYGSSLPALT